MFRLIWGHCNGGLFGVGQQPIYLHPRHTSRHMHTRMHVCMQADCWLVSFRSYLHRNAHTHILPTDMRINHLHGLESSYEAGVLDAACVSSMQHWPAAWTSPAQPAAMRRTRAAGSVPAMIKTRRLFFERGARYPLRFAMLPLLPALVRQVQLCCAGAALQRLALPEVLADRRRYLLLCTRGLEDQAEALLWRSLGREVPSWRIPPPQDLPRVSEGHAAVGKLVIGLKDGEDFPCGGIPGIIHIYALVDSAMGLSDDKEAAMKQLLTWTAGFTTGA